jgi:hypothetical protein
MFLKEKKDFDLLVVRVTALNWLETRWRLYDRGEMCLPGHFRGTFDACICRYDKENRGAQVSI